MNRLQHVASVGVTFLIVLGSGLVQHQLRHSSATYGQFGLVIGLVGFLFLLAKISHHGAELNPVLVRHLWVRGLTSTDPTEADDRVLSESSIKPANLRTRSPRGVFGDDAPAAAAAADADGAP